jgi:hypothetical protein
VRINIQKGKDPKRDVVIRMHARGWPWAYAAADAARGNPPVGYRLLAMTVSRRGSGVSVNLVLVFQKISRSIDPLPWPRWTELMEPVYWQGQGEEDAPRRGDRALEGAL